MEEKVLLSPCVCSYWIWCCSTGNSRLKQKKPDWHS